jgi:hypothetical protein
MPANHDGMGGVQAESMIDPPELTAENVATWDAALASLLAPKGWLINLWNADTHRRKYRPSHSPFAQREFDSLWNGLRLEQQEFLVVEFATRRLTR